MLTTVHFSNKKHAVSNSFAKLQNTVRSEFVSYLEECKRNLALALNLMNIEL